MVTKLDASALLKSDPIFVQIRGDTPKFEYSVGAEPVVMAIPLLNPDPNGPPILDSRAHVIVPPASSADPSHPAPPLLRTNVGLYGQQIRGGKDKIPVAIYQFRHVQPTADDAGKYSVRASRGDRTRHIAIRTRFGNHSAGDHRQSFVIERSGVSPG